MHLESKFSELEVENRHLNSRIDSVEHDYVLNKQRSNSPAFEIELLNKLYDQQSRANNIAHCLGKSISNRSCPLKVALPNASDTFLVLRSQNKLHGLHKWPDIRFSSDRSAKQHVTVVLILVASLEEALFLLPSIINYTLSCSFEIIFVLIQFDNRICIVSSVYFPISSSVDLYHRHIIE
ncbi:Uncharacterized protein FWK35_00027232 [Aphis craccivora]|uniref:Uncharacterized protein n=1 Tax=Aphis craccivora TaxID=307492 RepID=A0A6G0W2V0_APHCR|nr:Uncharacterized protein FWK35_00027232 [Aphis craccivora]